MTDKKKFTIVTSFNEDGYKTYGRKFVDSFIKFWPKSVELICYHHSDFPRVKKWDPKDFPKAKNITYFDMDQIPELDGFKQYTSHLIASKLPKEAVVNGVPWQLDAIKFTNKVFALQNANVNIGGLTEWLIWLDADTVTHKPVKNSDITKWVSGTPKPDIVHLPRTSTYYSETSFVAYNTENNRVRVFLDNLMSTFLSGEFQFYNEWHDGFIFERLLTIHKWNGLVTKSLTDPECKDLEAFQSSPLAVFMTHFKGNRKYVKEAKGTVNKPASNEPMPFIVKPQDCVPQLEIKKNIEENLATIKKWAVHIRPHKLTAIIASAGPSLKGNLKHIKKAQKNGAKVFCVKHSYPILIEAGIVPDYCVILDPREIDGVSTHGFVRKDLFKNASDKTDYMIASMTHPSVTKHFIGRGFNVIGWHATTGEFTTVVKEQKGKLNEDTTVSVTAGTCSAIRAIGVAEMLGFRSFELCGFDSSMPNPPVNSDEKLDTGLPKYYEVSLLPNSTQVYKGRVIGEGCQTFWTTGELIALYQDFMGIIPQVKRMIGNVKVLIDDTSLVGAGWKRYNAIIKAAEEKAKEQSKKINKSMTLAQFNKATISCYN